MFRIPMRQLLYCCCYHCYSCEYQVLLCSSCHCYQYWQCYYDTSACAFTAAVAPCTIISYSTIALAAIDILLALSILLILLLPGNPCAASGANAVHLPEDHRVRALSSERAVHRRRHEGRGHRRQAWGQEDFAIGAGGHGLEVGYLRVNR